MNRKRLVLLFLVLVVMGMTKVIYAKPFPQSEGQSYVVQADDWLSKLADKVYGDVLAWPAIWLGTNAKAVADESYAWIDNPDVIEVGQKLWLPDQAEANQWLQEYAASNAPEPVLPESELAALTAELGACYDPTTQKIFEIQGSQAASPLVNQKRVITGVVTADFQGPNQLKGFFVQDPTSDGDEATSDGLFVFTPQVAARPDLDVSVGQIVRVLGEIQEFKGLTELNALAIDTTCGTGSITPAPVELPAAAGDLERYEGMAVIFPQELSVTEHFQLGRFGEVVLSQGGRLIQPTQLQPPGQPAHDLQAQNEWRRIILDDGRSGNNLEPIPYPSPGLTASNTLRGGDTVTNLSGVLDYRFDTYRVQPFTSTLNFTPANPRPVTPPEVGGRIKVASFNVLNYFTTIDPDPTDDTPGKTADNICGPQTNLDCRGADSAAEFTRQHDKTIAALLAIDADIVGLIELENNPTASLQSLVDGLNDELGAEIYDFIDTGPIGTDAIKVGLIYKPGTVTPVGAHVLLDSSVDGRFNDRKNRPVLAQTFAEAQSSAAEPERVVVAVSHLKSKGSACNDVNDPNLEDGQGNCPLTRQQAALALADWLAADPTGTGTDNILIIGDLNSQAREFSIQALENAGYVNLIKQFLGDEAYSYAFGGQWGYLDYALANATLAPNITGVAEWHINADEPLVLDYNEEFKSAAQRMSLYEAEPFRVADHDPVMVGLFGE